MKSTCRPCILSGRYDEATPAQQHRLQEGIPGSRWTIFEHSAHLTFLEEPERYREVLTSFLDGVDTGLGKPARSSTARA